MNIISLNIRGCGFSSKRGRLNKIINKGYAYVVFIHETKIQHMNEDFVASLWGNKDVGWSTKDSEGASGGILIMWRIWVVSPLFNFRTKGSIGVCAHFKCQIFYFVNVYSSCLLERKKTCGQNWRSSKKVLVSVGGVRVGTSTQ